MPTNTYTTVADFLEDLDETKRAQVEVLRSIILASNTTLSEHIKWNAPSYILDGEDRITFNVRNKENLVKLVIHMGATRTENKKGTPVLDDASGLITWSSDIRGILTFSSLEDITSNKDVINDIVNRWLAIA
jgi:hypothetical protein